MDYIALPSTRITKKLDVIAPVYVGGLPKAYTVGSNVEAESYKGCMREFSLNGIYQDLLNSKALMGIRQCYQEVEHGVYFSYGAHAVYGEKMTYISILSVHGPFSDRVGLPLHNILSPFLSVMDIFFVDLKFCHIRL